MLSPEMHRNNFSVSDDAWVIGIQGKGREKHSRKEGSSGVIQSRRIEKHDKGNGV